MYPGLYPTIEENPELTQRANLTSMSDQEIFELVWENGQPVFRDLPRRGQKSPSCNAARFSHSSDAHVENGGDTFPPKRAGFGFGTSDSIVGNFHHDKDIYLNFTPNNSLQDDKLHEPSAKLYQTHFNLFLESDRGDDNFHKDTQVVPTNEHANLRNRCVSNYSAETPKTTTSQRDHSPLQQQQYKGSATLRRPNVESSQNIVPNGVFPGFNLQKQDLDQPNSKTCARTVNFSLFLRSPGLLNVNSDQMNCVTIPSSDPGVSSAEELRKYSPLEWIPIAPSNGPNRVDEGFHYQPNLVEANVDLLLPLSAEHSNKSPPDDQSEAVGREDAFINRRFPNQVDQGQTSNLPANTAKGKQTEKTIELPVASSSFCSRGASNNPTYTLKRRYEDTEDSAYPSENVEERPKKATKAVPSRANTGKRRRRIAEVHNQSERKRRDKINKKMRALQELIPNCNKVDKASMLDEAIEYLKSLQLQVQMMSMGTRVCIPPMLLPSGMQQMHAPLMTHLSHMGVGMGMRMPMSFGCNPAQFLFSPIPGATAVPGFPHTRIQIPGFPGQPLPMSVLPPPFGRLQPKTDRVAGHVSRASAPTQLMDSVTLPNSKDSIGNINSRERNNTNVKCSKSQPSI